MQAIWLSVCHVQSSADQIEIVFMIQNTLFHKVYRLALIPLVLLCASCVSSSKTFLPDGSKGYVVTCSGSMLSWGDCEAKAGSLCGAGGYEIVSVSYTHLTLPTSDLV